MKRGQPDTTFHASGEAETWIEEDDTGYGRGVNELLAALGYRTRSSDMADVALKLQQLEEAMVSSQGDGLTHLSSDTVHYNPSDLSTWLQSMISELGSPFDFDGPSPVPPLHNTAAFNDPFLPSSSVSMNFNSVLFEDSSSSDQFYLGAITHGSASGNFSISETAPTQGPGPIYVNSAQLEEPPQQEAQVGGDSDVRNDAICRPG